MSRCLGDEPVVREELVECSLSPPSSTTSWLGRSMAVTAQLRRRSTLLSAYHCWSRTNTVEIGGPCRYALTEAVRSSGFVADQGDGAGTTLSRNASAALAPARPRPSTITTLECSLMTRSFHVRPAPSADRQCRSILGCAGRSAPSRDRAESDGQA